MGDKLTDQEINHSQKILKSVSSAKWLKVNSVPGNAIRNESTQNWLQIFHCQQQNHWITATTIGCSDGIVKIYDSVYRHLDEPTKKTLHQVFPNDTRIKVVGTTQKQAGGKDCGVFATSMAFGLDISTSAFHQEKMRLNLARCFTENKLTIFTTMSL